MKDTKRRDQGERSIRPAPFSLLFVSSVSFVVKNEPL